MSSSEIPVRPAGVSFRQASLRKLPIEELPQDVRFPLKGDALRRLTLGLATALFSLFLTGLHIGIKKQPDPGQIQRASDFVSAPAKWLGRVAPSFELDLLDGTKFRLADHVGREVVLLNFFATWCEPCRTEMPELLRFQEQNAKQPFLLVAIDAGEETKLVQSFAEEFHLKIPVGIDRMRRLGRQFAVSAYPTSILIGADGRVLLYEASAIANADASLKPLVEPQLERIRSGKGISKEAYATAAASENYRGVVAPERNSGILLQGRARTIAEKTGCLCGCSNKLLDCSCQTATGMKKKLKEGNFGNKSDGEIITELGREFCMKGM